MTNKDQLNALNEQLAQCRANNDTAGFAVVYKQIEKLEEFNDEYK